MRMVTTPTRPSLWTTLSVAAPAERSLTLPKPPRRTPPRRTRMTTMMTSRRMTTRWTRTRRSDAFEALQR